MHRIQQKKIHSKFPDINLLSTRILIKLKKGNSVFVVIKTFEGKSQKTNRNH